MIEDSKISGLLYYVTDFTGFSGEPEKQQGNFLALSFDANPDVEIKVTFINELTPQGPLVLEPGDRDCVFRITNKDTQKIKVEASLGNDYMETTYDLSELVLDEADEMLETSDYTE